ncbi:MAG: OB-fold domain-containing protein [Pseudomonadota bacterium]
MLLRSKTSGAFIFYPRVIEPGTGSTELEWVEASGLGTVYATTVVRKKIPSDNYNVALIDLAEGPRMMSRVEGVSPAQVRIGLRVRARVVQGEEQAFVVFEPDENIDVTVKGNPA